MTDLGDTVNEIARTVTVTRRATPVYDGSSPRPVIGPDVTFQLRAAVQRGSKGRALDRKLEGDETAGDARLWVADDALAAAGVTELRIAPEENTDGPPADWVDFQGTRYEVTALLGWDADFDGEEAGFQRYVMTEIGGAP